jgi:hypothetical protein
MGHIIQMDFNNTKALAKTEADWRHLLTSGRITELETFIMSFYQWSIKTSSTFPDTWPAIKLAVGRIHLREGIEQ